MEEPILDVAVLKKQIEEVSGQAFSLCIGNAKKVKKYLAEFSDVVYDEKRKENLEKIKRYNNEESFVGDVDPEFIPLSPFSRGNLTESFCSEINFFDCLKEISNAMVRAPKRLEFLQQAIKALNAKLPASVYLPFSSSFYRNCVILHIAVSEARVFATKERAPFKLAFEIFCPHEELKTSRNSGVFHENLKGSIISEYAIIGENLNKENIGKEKNDFPGPINFLKPDFEEQHYQSLSVVSDGLSAVYYGDDKDPKFYLENVYEQEQRIKNISPYGGLVTWKLVNVIIKSGDDLRQDQLVIQLMAFFNRIFKEKNLDIWLYPYDIIATHNSCGIIECVPNAITIDGLKKALPNESNSLYDYFRMQMGKESSAAFKNAQLEFMKSLVGYSLVCYILQIKDRHNGNILIDSYGHVIHIDFGFILGNSPGGGLNFESAPFKLTDEFERILGGRRSGLFMKFRSLCVKGYKAIIEKAEQIELMVEMMKSGSGMSMPCFRAEEAAVQGLRQRLLPMKTMGKTACKQYINSLIDDSLDHWSTRCYDRFQYCCQGIFY